MLHTKVSVSGSILLFISLLPGLTFADIPECNFQKVTERIYVMVGSDHKTCPIKEIENPLTNPSMIVGESGVVIVDPGSSVQVGELVLDRIKNITSKPVVAVFNTHIHGLYWLGNQAIKAQNPDVPVYAHQRMIERVESGEGLFWVDAITGKHKGKKTVHITPDKPLFGGEELNIAGMRIKIHHTGHAHTDHDIMIELPEENAVFLGGIVVEPEVPSQGVPGDANFKGQIEATRYAIDLNAKTYIPGRGNPDDIQLPKRAYRFIDTLYGSVKQYYADGLSDYEITARLKEELKHFQEWYDFTQLGGVISNMYLQIERDDF